MSKFTKKQSKTASLCAPKKMLGVYEISCQSSIHRAFGEDTNGILYIGKSKRLGDRIAHFWACAEGKIRSGHPAGVKYFALKYHKFPAYSLKGLVIRWSNEVDEPSAILAEAKLLEKYWRKFGEVPPLNDAKPKV